MFSPVVGFLDVIVHRDGVCFSPLEAFLMLSYTGMLYVLSCRGFLVVIVHRDGVCSLLRRLSYYYRKQGWHVLSPV